MHPSPQPHPSPLPTLEDTILTRYLDDALSISQIAAEVRRTVREVLEVIQSEKTQAILRALSEAETRRHELLRAHALTRAFHTLTALTDSEVGGSDRFLELQRKAAAALLREAASAARTQALAERPTRRARSASIAPSTPTTAPNHAPNHAPHHAPANILAPRATVPTSDLPRNEHARGLAVPPPARTPRTRSNAHCPPHHAPRRAHLVRSFARRRSASSRAASPTRPPSFFCHHPSVRSRYTAPCRAPHPAPRARSPPEHPGKTLKNSLFEKSLFFLPLCWHRSVLEACSVWSDRNARSRAFGSCCAAPRTWSAFSKGREVRCEECSPDLGRGCCVRARWRGSGRLGLLVR